RCGPEAVVLGRGPAFIAREGAQRDALQAELFAVLHLGDGVGDVAHRQRAHAYQPVGIDRAVLLGEPGVVARDDRLVGVVVLNVAPPARGGALKQHFGVEPVLVLLADALLGGAGARRVFVALAERRPAVVVR